MVKDDGQAIDAALLKGETAAPQLYGQRALVYQTEATGLTPERLGEILRGANMGLSRSYLTLAIDMEERYLHYSSQLQTRRLALDGVTLSVSAPDGANANVVDAVQRLIDDPILRDMIQDMQDGLGKGYSVIEPKWDYQEGALKPVVYQHRDARYFRYDEIGLRSLHLLDESGLPGLKIGAPYFITHEPRVRAGVPIRAGLARSAAWAFLVQSFTLQDWAAFCEVYGLPFRVGKYGPQATAEDKATLLRAVRGIANDAAAIIPAGMEIVFQEVSGNRGEAVFGHLIDYLDRKISLAVIGQTMTSENGSSLGQAKVHNEVRHDIQKFDARATASTLNRDLVRPFVAMNFGPQQIYPTLQLEIAEPEDLKALGIIDPGPERDSIAKTLTTPKVKVTLHTAAGDQSVRLYQSDPQKGEAIAEIGPDAPLYRINPGLIKDLTKDLFNLQDKRLFGLDYTDVAMLSVKTREQEYILINQSGEWALEDQPMEKVTQEVADLLVSRVANLPAEERIMKQSSPLAPYGLLSPAAEFVATAKDGKTTGRLTLGSQSGNLLYATGQRISGLFQVRPDLLTQIPSKSELLGKTASRTTTGR